MTASATFSKATQESITATMASRRDAALSEEIALVEKLRSEGVENPELEANMTMIFGAKETQRSPTPKVNLDWKP